MPDEKPEPKKFSFNLFIGRKPDLDDSTYKRLLEEATREAESSPDGVGIASTPAREFRLTFDRGLPRIAEGDSPPGQPMTPEQAREAEAWERLSRIGTGAYPDTARLHRILRNVVTVVGAAIPIAMLILGIASGQTQETVFFMTFGGLIVGLMIMKTIPG
jgi:hypothetical protein